MGHIRIRTEVPGPQSQALIRRRDAAVPRDVAQSAPVFAASADGVWVTGVDGNVYLDFAGGIGVMNVGHSAPSVVAALTDQANRFSHVCCSVLPYESYVSLAERLARLSPGNFPKKTLFVNSGADAIENAVKIARHATGRPGELCFEGGFHARTLLALSLTSKVEPYKLGYAPFVADVLRVPYAYCYRCAYRAENPPCRFTCVDEIEHHFKRHADQRTIAAVVWNPFSARADSSCLQAAIWTAWPHSVGDTAFSSSSTRCRRASVEPVVCLPASLRASNRIYWSPRNRWRRGCRWRPSSVELN